MILFDVRMYSVRRSTDFLGSEGSYNAMMIKLDILKLKVHHRV